MVLKALRLGYKKGRQWWCRGWRTGFALWFFVAVVLYKLKISWIKQFLHNKFVLWHSTHRAGLKEINKRKEASETTAFRVSTVPLF